MEEDGGASSREWLVAGAGTGSGGGGGAGGVEGGPSAGGGARPPQAPPKSVGEVRGILERNRVLIQEISQNQETRDADGLTRNVSLIRELNTNMARVVDLYGGLSSCYGHIVAAKKAAAAAAAVGDKGDTERPRSSGAGQQQ
ncbi:EARLY flowering 4 protein [Panicum miliaceum]|uniref:EARLY flowering 4 protein n=1 Tax=Panicum miliaceum TaxID=4540 RepID=A0A3L6T905_PANMI|nr:EARLY flowering 4 protein [Panicum miliaceum]